MWMFWNNFSSNTHLLSVHQKVGDVINVLHLSFRMPVHQTSFCGHSRTSLLRMIFSLCTMIACSERLKHIENQVHLKYASVVVYLPFHADLIEVSSCVRP